MNIFEILSTCDWVSPVIESAKDVRYNLTSKEGKTPISVDKYSLDATKKLLRDNGIEVVSEAWTAFSREAMLDIPDSQVRLALAIIEANS